MGILAHDTNDINAQYPGRLDERAAHEQADRARQAAGGNTDAGDEAYLTVMQQHMDPHTARVNRLLAEGGPLADRIRTDMRAVMALAETHFPWCKPAECVSAADIDPGAHYHLGAELVTATDDGGQVTARLVCLMLPDGRAPQPGDDGLPKISVDVDGDFGMSPDQARAVAANLLFLASLAETTPDRDALRALFDGRDGNR